jgi:signal transduction histidine kinase
MYLRSAALEEGDYGQDTTVVALKTLARRSAVPVALELNLGSRLDEHLEAAAYYIASETLTNAAKHAQASVIDIRADGRDGGLTLSVRDDGVGGADPRRGAAEAPPARAPSDPLRACFAALQRGI